MLSMGMKKRGELFITRPGQACKRLQVREFTEDSCTVIYGDKQLEVRQDELTELEPGVSVQMGPQATTRGLRLAFKAPRSVLITRTEQ